MSGAEGGEDRLSANEFAELIQHLPAQEMFLIEYRTATRGWHKLFTRNSKFVNQFICHLCAADASSLKNLLSHINGRKHMHHMQSVVNLYHPEYTPPKDSAKEMSDSEPTIKSEEDKTPAIDAKQKNVQAEGAEVSNDKNNSKVNEDKASNQSQATKNPSTNMVEYPVVSRKGETQKAVQNAVSPRKVEKSNKTMEIVRNPAAASPIVIEDEEKPQYETDKIIVPTSSKNTSAKNSKQHSPSKNLPTFSTKTYSSKPSDDDVRGILGVEYVIKLINKNNSCVTRYECGLCELVLDAYAMQKHLEGYNHRLKFCEKHFPTAIRHYLQYMQGIPEHDSYKVMTPVLLKLAIAIEKHHGRNLPYECYESDFTLHRHDILAKAFSCRHASEQYGPTFTHVVDAKEIDKLINDRNKYAPPPFSRTAIFDRKDGRDTEPNEITQTNGRGSSIPKDRHKNVVRENNIMLPVQTHNFNNQVDKFNTPQFLPRSNYMHFPMASPSDNPGFIAPPASCYQPPNMMEPLMPNSGVNKFPANSMMESFMPNSGYNYQMQPPINLTPYNEPQLGQSVDDQRYNNMVDEFLRGTLKGIHGNTSRKRSPRTSNSSFPPPKRQHQEEIRKENDKSTIEKEIEALHAEFRKYRRDPETYPPYNDEWQKFWKRRKDELIAAGKDHRSHNYQPEWVKFIKDHIDNVYREKLESINMKRQAHSGLSQLSNSNNGPNNNGVNDMTANKSKPKADHTQVVAVLRLMAALEENLGSLGPKIISLLSKALQLEKTKREDINSYLLNNENCSVIETAKEKFKGLLLAGIVEGSKQRAMKKAIEGAEALLSVTQHLRARSYNQSVSNTLEQQKISETQAAPTISDILKFLRAHSDRK